MSELRESFGKDKEQYGSEGALDLRVWIDSSRKITGIKVNIIKGQEMSEERKAQMSEILRNARRLKTIDTDKESDPDFED